MPEEKYKSRLPELEITPDSDIERDQALMFLRSDNKWSEVFTLGNISCIIGKAKSRKTFFITMVVAGLITNKNPMIKSQLSGKIALFDTEQGKYHVWKMTKRIQSMLGNWYNNLRVFCLRPLNVDDRIREIENYVYLNDVQLLVIDGIRDLVTDINNAVQSTEVVGKLMKWSFERNMHICVVIHQNKGDENARGHIGAEIVNKSETVISVTKDKQNSEISVVKSEYTRGIEVKPFTFLIDRGIPVVEETMLINHYDPKTEDEEVPF